MVLQIFLTSTRPGRVGDKVAEWFEGLARQHGKFEVEMVDLAKVNLPFLDEPNHPRLQQYTQQRTKDFSALVSRADAYVFVIPEYNYFMPATLLNAIDYLLHEWKYKPAGLVSYGGVSAGTRSAQMAKLPISAVGMVPLSESVHIPFVAKQINDQDQFISDERIDKSATIMLDELYKWAEALKPLHSP